MAGDIVQQGPPVTAIRFADDGRFPNNRLPLLHYPSALQPSIASIEALEALLAANRWQPRWRATIYPFHHYHSTAHEALGVAAGKARLMLGGPLGTVIEVTPGDVIVIPAGVGHCRLSSEAGFLVVGGYPPGQEWDFLKGEDGDRPRADHNIAAVPLPKTDPVFGTFGPLLNLWATA